MNFVSCTLRDPLTSSSSSSMLKSPDVILREQIIDQDKIHFEVGLGSVVGEIFILFLSVFP